MKTLALPILAFLFATLVACHSKRAPEEVVIPDGAPIVEGSFATQATVLGVTADVRLGLQKAVKASEGLPSEAEVRAATAKVEESLAKVEEALKKHPPEEVAALVAQFEEAIKQLREIIKQRDQEIAQLKDANAKRWHWILYGGAVACTLLAVASGFFASSIPLIGPYLGPRIGILFGALAGTLYVLGYLYDWTREHPVYTGIGVALLLGGSLGLAWANKVDHDKTKTLKTA